MFNLLDFKSNIQPSWRGGVLPPDSLSGRKDILVLICSAQLEVQKAASRQLENLGLDFLTIEEYIFAKRKDKILKCVELLEDEKDKEIYTEIVESRITYRLPKSNFISRDQYFILPEFRAVSKKEVFVDCGAFVGDSVEKYIFAHDGTFGKIIAFEPDIINYRAMQVHIERLNREWALPEDKIQIVNAGVGSKTTTGILTQQARTSSAISEMYKKENLDSVVKIYSLDDFFADQRIDFLKADIESFELEMLQGAEKIIRRDLPKIAICIYHSSSDIYQIILWLANLDLGYKFSVRYYRWGYLETVLYAYH